MKQIITAGGLALVLLAGCTETPPTTTVVEQFYGKRLVADNGAVFTFSPDGTVGGSFDGVPVVGTYNATATEVCSTYSSPKRLTGREFCSTPAINGDQVIFNRRDGSQSQPYRIQG